MDRLGSRSFLLMILALWVGAWIWVARFYYIDDTLIGLRYADMLRQHGFLTFDGVHPSYGTSSVLYVVLLAAAGHILHSVFLPKVLSVIAYVTLLGITLRNACKSRGVAQNLWVLLLIVFASPMAVRWFTDGMETGLATAFALMLGAGTFPDTKLPFGSRKPVVPMLLAFGAVFVRVEMAFLLAFVCLGNAAYRRAEMRSGGEARAWTRAIVREIQVAAGVALALLAIWLMTGHMFSDAAIAKAQGFKPPVSYLMSVASSFAAALSLGVGLLLLWIPTMAGAWRHGGSAKLRALAVVNLALPAEVFTAMVRGQGLAGIRYFLPAVVLMVAWNLAFLEATWRPAISVVTPGHARSIFSPMSPPIVWGLAILMLGEWGYEGHRFKRIIDTHTAALQEMRSQHLEVFAGQKGIASDIGFISYFTDASICDMGGLVNGRQFAIARPAERARRCAESSPDFAFVNAGQGKELSPWISFQGWPICHSYEFSNAFETDPHDLLVRPEMAPLDCPQGNPAGAQP